MAVVALETEGGFSISIVPPTHNSAVTLRHIESAAIQKSTLGKVLWPRQPGDPEPTNTDNNNTDGAVNESVPTPQQQAQDERTLKFLQDPINQFFFVTDTATRQRVAFSWWQHAKGKTDEEWADVYKNRFRSPRMNQELSDAVNGARILKRPKILKNMDYFTLKELYVRPEYQRKGLGSRLVRWGVQRADELGLPSYIEASAMGLGLYTKFGFKEVDHVSVDLEPYGGDKGDINTYTLLFREAKKA